MNDLPFIEYTFNPPEKVTSTNVDFQNFNFDNPFDVPQSEVDFNLPDEPIIDNSQDKVDIPKPVVQKTIYNTTNKNDRGQLINEMRKLKFSEDEIKYYDKLAGRESSWKNHSGVDAGKGRSARGYFQFLDSTLRGLGINKPANELTITEQLLAIKKFTDNNRRQLTPFIEKAKALGFNEWGLLGGAHLGGVGGVKKFISSGKAASDKFGTKISDYMSLFSK